MATLAEWSTLHGRSVGDAAEMLATARNLDTVPGPTMKLAAEDEAVLSEWGTRKKTAKKIKEVVSERMEPEIPDHIQAADRHNSRIESLDKPYTVRKYLCHEVTGNLKDLVIVAIDEGEAVRVFRRCHAVDDSSYNPTVHVSAA